MRIAVGGHVVSPFTLEEASLSNRRSADLSDGGCALLFGTVMLKLSVNGRPYGRKILESFFALTARPAENECRNS